MVRRLSLLLIATLLVAPWWRHQERLHPPHPSASLRAVGQITPSVFTIPSSSRPNLMGSLSLVGYRLKSENEETDLLVARAPLRRRPLSGDPFASSLVRITRADRSGASGPLRC
jgi:hypothetical protein